MLTDECLSEDLLKKQKLYEIIERQGNQKILLELDMILNGGLYKTVLQSMIFLRKLLQIQLLLHNGRLIHILLDTTQMDENEIWLIQI